MPGGINVTDLTQSNLPMQQKFHRPMQLPTYIPADQARKLAQDLAHYGLAFHKFGPHWGVIAADFERMRREAERLATSLIRDAWLKSNPEERVHDE